MKALRVAVNEKNSGARWRVLAGACRLQQHGKTVGGIPFCRVVTEDCTVPHLGKHQCNVSWILCQLHNARAFVYVYFSEELVCHGNGSTDSKVRLRCFATFRGDVEPPAEVFQYETCPVGVDGIAISDEFGAIAHQGFSAGQQAAVVGIAQNIKQVDAINGRHGRELAAPAGSVAAHHGRKSAHDSRRCIRPV